MVTIGCSVSQLFPPHHTPLQHTAHFCSWILSSTIQCDQQFLINCSPSPLRMAVFIGFLLLPDWSFTLLTPTLSAKSEANMQDASYLYIFSWMLSLRRTGFLWANISISPTYLTTFSRDHRTTIITRRHTISQDMWKSIQLCGDFHHRCPTFRWCLLCALLLIAEAMPLFHWDSYLVVLRLCSNTKLLSYFSRRETMSKI